MDNGVDLNNVVIGVNNTTNTTDLFSPTGGGITVPATSMAEDPINDIWYYPTASIPQMGTNAEDRMAVLQVTQGVCDQINVKANAANISRSRTTTMPRSEIRRTRTTISVICWQTATGRTFLTARWSAVFIIPAPRPPPIGFYQILAIQ